MAFDFSTLITDRSPEDLQALRDLLATPMADWTAEQLAEFNRAVSKGTYNYTDLNRVIAAMDDINERLTAAGYVTGYQRIQVPHQGGGRLPARYTELQYIESSGTQYIETGFTPNQDSRVICEFQLLDAYTSIRGVFGVRDSASGTAAQQFILWNNGASSFRTDYFGSQETLSSLSAQAQYTADKNRNVTTMGGQSVTNPSASGQCANDLVIFGVNNVGTVEYISAMRLYACQVYDNGDLVLNLVPCEDPDGDIGLYDLVSAQFLGNSGGGVFSAGPEAPPLIPDGYIALEYIQSSGGQYIDTGVMPNQRTRCVIDADVLSSNTGDNHHLGSISQGSNYFAIRLKSDLSGYAARWGTQPITDVVSAGAVFGRHTFDRNQNEVIIDDAEPTTFPATIWSISLSFPLFAFRNSQTSYNGFISMSLYSCQVYDDGALVRDFRPYRNDDGDVGLYDMVTRQFFSNLGEGAFSAGPEISPADQTLDPYTWYEADTPTSSQMQQYLANGAALRDALTMADDLPDLPPDMDGLTQAEANDIEALLGTINDYLEAMQRIFLRSGMAWAISGGPNFYFVN